MVKKKKYIYIYKHTRTYTHTHIIFNNIKLMNLIFLSS